MNGFKIKVKKGLILNASGERTVSPALAKLFELFSRQQVLHAHDVLFQCYGILKVDEGIHFPKLFSLLTRGRRVLADKSLVFRNPYIYFMNDPCLIEIDLDETNNLAPHQLSRKPKFEFSEFANKLMIKRIHIQAHFGISKSSAHRLLLKWERQGKIHKIKHGPKSYYQPAIKTRS